MIKDEILKTVIKDKEKMILDRRFLHMNPGTGFDIGKTKEYVKTQLTGAGYEPRDCGRAGITVCAGGRKPGKVFLLRADMDGLPIEEESDFCCKSENGRMHACGHDMHTAMLLEAARLLKEFEDEIDGTVKLMFQPAEEIFEGSKDMIKAGVLKNPDVDAGLMIHVMADMPLPNGTAVVCGGGVSAPAADFFTVKIRGRGCHGSMPDKGIDPINVAAHIIIALQEINARELSVVDDAVLTVGAVHAGNAGNAIPNTAELTGTIRTYDEDVRKKIKKRMTEIVFHTAAAFRAEAETVFGSGCPTLVNDAEISGCTVKYIRELYGESMAFTADELGGESSKSAGSEDFAYVSHEIPTIMLAMAAGHPEKGYIYPQHHPKVMFDEDALTYGAAIYAYTAMRWLEEHK